jgi:cysteine desulfurase family protein (TIGR01976 family)
MADHPFDLESVRRQFPALNRTHNGRPVIFFDGPAGSQVPQSVADAVSRCLLETNANHGGPFATSRESDAILDEAHRAGADFLGASDPDEVSFGANMTTITLGLSRALAKTWQPGDEILVTRLDHDANVTPWTLAARDAGVTVKHVEFDHADCTLDIEDFEAKLTDRTRLVAVAYASNAAGTINPITEIVKKAHGVGALVFIDAVHFAPHGLIDVAELDCDFLGCSAYKFFGPHVGMLWGRRELLESLTAYKLRPSTNELPGKWMTGTQNHEGIAGVLAAIDYLADVGRAINPADSRRESLQTAFAAIGEYERELCHRLLAGLAELPDVCVHGITNLAQLDERVPTVSFTHRNRAPLQIAERLAERGIFVWPGNHYALPFTEALGLEPGGTLRVGLLHYNTAEEVDRLLAELAQL